MDDFDIDHLNFEQGEEAVAKRQQELEQEKAIEPSNECEGGACTI